MDTHLVNQATKGKGKGVTLIQAPPLKEADTLRAQVEAARPNSTTMRLRDVKASRLPVTKAEVAIRATDNSQTIKDIACHLARHPDVRIMDLAVGGRAMDNNQVIKDIARHLAVRMIDLVGGRAMDLVEEVKGTARAVGVKDTVMVHLIRVAKVD